MTLCTICDSIDLGSASIGARPSLHPETTLGLYPELLTRAKEGCEACEFFCRTLQSSVSWKDRLDVLEDRIVVFSGLRLDVRKNQKQRRSWSCDDLLFDVCVPEEYQGEGHEEINREEVDERHIIPVDPLDEKALKQVKNWLSECESHENCSTPHTVKLPKKIIEIPSDPTVAPRVCLAEGKIGAYIVLSHCSGDIQTPSITNFPTPLDVGALPKTIADAITTTRRLGYRYLWAAPLCITQDSKSDWSSESSKFTLIYGQAALMISATEGVDSNSGILHERHILYSPALGLNKNRYLRLHLLRWKWDLERSALGKRGWAAIERMLAPRILHFARRQLIWECASGHKFEASAIIDKHYGAGQLRQTYRKEIIQPYIKKALQDHPIEVEAVGSEAEISRDGARLEAWLNCVDEFSARSLRDLEDKLIAMSSIANIIDDGTMGEYLAGVWSKNIAFGLAWGRVNSLLSPASTYRAPSWSWASVDGAISSIATAWPETMMQDHAKDPAWLEKYEPKLVSYHMVFGDPAYPYGSVREGSHIFVSGSCIGLMNLAESLNDESPFSLNIGMDSSPVFECTCCIQRPEEERKTASEKFSSEADHHLCMILMGDAWRTGPTYDQHKGICDLVILKAHGDEDGTYEKVGFVRVQKEYFGNSKTFDEVHEVWDGMAWERRVLKLI
ncbi:hypothetical protein D0Z07_4765 [Hyphodiscus hymeniophilus]|uniref:Heterokaryon incompatibility domain-containing protein n=1 Tax=Hyphodiscus hymeniophilus TaxID=353542 RepID=A0A9P6VJD8_9HELO|nr:hypothetical protein D0Z07_4765 [Hyphodiscus hymeniophilus]